MATFDAPAVIMAVLGGDLDGDLGDIHNAIKRRVAESGARFCWRVVFDDVEVTEENQTMSEVESVERSTGKKWGQFTPFGSAVECAAIIAAALVHRQKMKPMDAIALIGTRTGQDVLACVSEYELTEAPKDEASATP